MTKSDAILRIKEIQNGNSSFYTFPEYLKGRIAKRIWNSKSGFDNINFKYGFEYGEIMGLINAFDINTEDLK